MYYTVQYVTAFVGLEPVASSQKTPNAEPSIEAQTTMDVDRLQASLGASTSRAIDIQMHSHALELVASPLWIYDSKESSNLWGNR